MSLLGVQYSCFYTTAHVQVYVVQVQWYSSIGITRNLLRSYSGWGNERECSSKFTRCLRTCSRSQFCIPRAACEVAVQADLRPSRSRIVNRLKFWKTLLWSFSAHKFCKIQNQSNTHNTLSNIRQPNNDIHDYYIQCITRKHSKRMGW